MKKKVVKPIHRRVSVFGIGIIVLIALLLIAVIHPKLNSNKPSIANYTISGGLPKDNTFYVGEYTPGVPYNDDVTGHVKPNYRAVYITSWLIRYGVGLPDDEFEGQIINGYPGRLKGSIDFRKLTNSVSFGTPDKLVSDVLDEANFGPTEVHYVLFYSSPESPATNGYYYLYSLSSSAKPLQVAAFDAKQFASDIDARIEPIGSNYIAVSFGKIPYMNCWGNEKYIVNVKTGKLKKIGEVVEITHGPSDNEISFKRVMKRPGFQCSSGGYELTLDHKIENELNVAYSNVVSMDLSELE